MKTIITNRMLLTTAFVSTFASGCTLAAESEDQEINVTLAVVAHAPPGSMVLCAECPDWQPAPQGTLLEAGDQLHNFEDNMMEVMVYQGTQVDFVDATPNDPGVVFIANPIGVSVLKPSGKWVRAASGWNDSLAVRVFGVSATDLRSCPLSLFTPIL